ncbi:MAG: MlaD family protein [Synechococcaceae cyanobacterium]|nr:MlaD family protein [Synechococcaceae cyanobacterium]
MRRSVREALVGFSLLAGLAGGLGFWAWLRGISLSRSNWTIEARFDDAAGLAERSPVTFRGVLVGNVRRVQVREDAVVAQLEITDPNLRIARPAVARIAASSLLGGDATVSLLSAGKPLSLKGPGPRDRGCETMRMVCDGSQVSGVAAPTIDTVTETVQKLLDQADKAKLIGKMEAATVSFERTARETEKLSRDAQVFLRDGRELVAGLNRAVQRTDPILTNVTAASRNINAASADAARASRSARNIAATLDNPRSLADLQATLANARRLTDQWQAVGGDVRKLTDDPKFLDGIRAVSVGLGRFFAELYPAQTDAARARELRGQARQRQEHQRQQELDDRLAPRSKAPALTPPR